MLLLMAGLESFAGRVSKLFDLLSPGLFGLDMLLLLEGLLSNVAAGLVVPGLSRVKVGFVSLADSLVKDGEGLLILLTLSDVAEEVTIRSIPLAWSIPLASSKF